MLGVPCTELDQVRYPLQMPYRLQMRHLSFCKGAMQSFFAEFFINTVKYHSNAENIKHEILAFTRFKIVIFYRINATQI